MTRCRSGRHCFARDLAAGGRHPARGLKEEWEAARREETVSKLSRMDSLDQSLLARCYFHFSSPSTMVMYRSTGTFVKRSTFPLGRGHLISSQSTLGWLPNPSTTRGSCEERYPPPPTFVR